jgi:tetratricopeptide (TPR) repeat protein
MSAKQRIINWQDRLTLQAVLALLAAAFFCLTEPVSAQSVPSTTEADGSRANGDYQDRTLPAAERYALREKGVKALADNLLPTAENYFHRYREATGTQEPDFADATVQLVKVFLLQGKAQDAALALDAHGENSPGLNDPYYRDALIYYRGAVKLALQQLTEAVEAVQPLIVRQDTSVEFRRQAAALVGDAYARQQQWTAAERAFRQYLIEFSKTESAPQIRLALARVLIAQAKYAEAAELLDQVMAQAGESLKTEIMLSRLLLATAQNDLEQALTLYNQLQPVQPLRPDRLWWTPISQLVDKLLAEQRFETVLPIIAKAEALATSRQERLQMRRRQIEAMLALTETDQAAAAVEKLKTDFPNAPETPLVEMKLGQQQQNEKKHLAAARSFDNVAGNEQASATLRYQAALARGWCLLDAMEYDSASQAFARAAKLGTAPEEQAQAYYFAGNAAFDAGNFTAAAMFYQSIADNFRDSEFAERALFRQAQSRARAGLHANAALLYKQFLQNFTQSQLAAEAVIQRGIALRNGGDPAGAVSELNTFVRDFPESPLVPRALLEAYAAAKTNGDVAATIGFLTQIINRFPDSELYPHALYQRIHTHFLHGHQDAALADARLFMEKFPRLPLATDVLLWMGDWYANTGDLAAAESYYLQAAASHPALPQAQAALLAAAKISYKRDNYDRAILLLDQLQADYQTNPLPLVQAQAEVLYGDILSETGRYMEAVLHFERAHQLLPDQEVGLAAHGRSGDMYYSAGTEMPSNRQPTFFVNS